VSEGMYHLINGDCLEALRELRDGCVDAVVTDPPAGISFMGKKWDSPNTFPLRDRGELPGGSLPKQTPHKHSRGFANGVTFDKTRRGRDAFLDFLTPRLAECLRVCRPGAVALVWALPRTSHWTALAIEEAGWVIEEKVYHHFGTGFPKHRSKLKPSTEEWILCRKPGPLWLGVEECRVSTNGESLSGGRVSGSVGQTSHEGWRRPWMEDSEQKGLHVERAKAHLEHAEAAGRWPANLVLSHSPGCRPVGMRRVKGSNPIGPNPGGKPGYSGYAGNGAGHDFTDADGTEEVEHWECVDGCPVKALDEQAGERHSYCSNPATAEAASGKEFVNKDRAVYELAKANGKAFTRGRMYADKGGPSRFYATFPPDTERFLYCSKASKKDRGEGNTHPTVKSTALMAWLVKLACPEGGLVLDPFGGTFSTGIAAVRAGRYFIGIESDPEYFATGRARMEAAR
jgi:DNA modification methylase